MFKFVVHTFVIEFSTCLVLVSCDVVPFETYFIAKTCFEVGLHFSKRYMVVGAFWTRKTWLNGTQVELHYITRIDGVLLATIISSEQASSLKVAFNEMKS